VHPEKTTVLPQGNRQTLPHMLYGVHPTMIEILMHNVSGDRH